MKRHLSSSYMAVGFCQTKKNNLWTTELLNKVKKKQNPTNAKKGTAEKTSLSINHLQELFPSSDG